MSKGKLGRLLCLVTLVAATIVSAIVPVQASGPSTSPRESLRQANLADAPIVDAITPKPAITGKSDLFVDGKFYQQAPPDVIDFVCTVAKQSIPIVVLGTDLADVCNSLNVGYDRVISKDIAVVASVVKLYPDQIVDGKPFVSQITICGRNMSLKSAIGVAQDFVAKEAKRTFQHSMFHEANSSGLAILSAPYWLEYASRETYLDYGSCGNFNIIRSYVKLYNDGSSTYDWRDVKYIMQSVPGFVKHGNSWRTDWTKMRAYSDWDHYVPGHLSEGKLIQYAPTTTSGTSTVHVSVGTVAGSAGASVTAALSWSYSISDVQVLDFSDFQDDRFQLQHQINEQKNVGKQTYEHIPGASYRIANNDTLHSEEYYQIQWARYKWPVWTHITQAEVLVLVNGC